MTRIDRRPTSQAPWALPGIDPRPRTARHGAFPDAPSPGGDHPFDAAAGDYDAAFSHRPLGRWLRRRVWDRLAEYLPKTGRVLDLGCGTGEDALWLAERGMHVKGLDAAPRMLERAVAKLERKGLNDRADFIRCDLDDAGALARIEDAEAGFDGAVSNFGAFNCVRDRRSVGTVLSRLLRPGAHLVLVVMGPFCLWETLVAVARGQPRGAFRRLRGGVPAGIGAGAALPVWYPSPLRLRAELAPTFRHIRTEALGLLLPPTPCAGLVERHLRLFGRLGRLEQAMASLPLAAWASDHYLCVFGRR